MHERKKDGERKDKKNKRMREDVKARHEAAGPDRPTTDEKDVTPYKPGSMRDHNQDPTNKSQQGHQPK